MRVESPTTSCPSASPGWGGFPLASREGRGTKHATAHARRFADSPPDEPCRSCPATRKPCAFFPDRRLYELSRSNGPGGPWSCATVLSILPADAPRRCRGCCQTRDQPGTQKRAGPRLRVGLPRPDHQPIGDDCRARLQRSACKRFGPPAKVAELADAPDLGSGGRKAVGVRVPPFAPDFARRRRASSRQAKKGESSLAAHSQGPACRAKAAQLRRRAVAPGARLSWSSPPFRTTTPQARPSMNRYST